VGITANGSIWICARARCRRWSDDAGPARCQLRRRLAYGRVRLSRGRLAPPDAWRAHRTAAGGTVRADVPALLQRGGLPLRREGPRFRSDLGMARRDMAQLPER